MRKRECWLATSRSSASISTKQAKLSWVSPCFMTTPRLLLALCKKRHLPTKRPERKRKPIAWPNSSAINIRITPAADCSVVTPSTFWLDGAMEKLRPCIAEFIGTFALIFVGIGAIKTAGHDVLAVALAHGLTIAAFVSATMHISGGHLNPAVTFGVVCSGNMTWAAAIRYWIAQLLGGVSAAFICLSLFGRDVVVTGTPQLAINLTPGQGILVEGILTFFLVFVVHGTAVDERGRRVAGLAIGATITLDIL